MKLNRAISSDSSQLIGQPLEYKVKRISIFCPLARVWDTKRQSWPIRMKVREAVHRQLFRYAENLLYVLLSSIHRINCHTPVGCTKIRPLTCCVISLAQYIILCLLLERSLTNMQSILIGLSLYCVITCKQALSSLHLYSLMLTLKTSEKQRQIKIIVSYHFVP